MLGHSEPQTGLYGADQGESSGGAGGIGRGVAEEELAGHEAESGKKAGAIERRRIWIDEVLADFIREELGFPGARQPVMLEKEMVNIATWEVSRERWYLLTSLDSRRWAPQELVRVIRNHWEVENSLHHGKDRSWGEGVHTLRRPGLGEVTPAWSTRR